MISLRLSPTWLLLICLIFLPVVCKSQEHSTEARRIFGFYKTHADSELAYLDEFVDELGKSDRMQAYIIGYGSSNLLQGRFLRKIFGYRDYLINRRGIEPALINVIKGENKESPLVEFWLVPKGEAFPKLAPEVPLQPQTAFKFDEILLGIGCLPEFTVDLYEFKDAISFYAQALNENAKLRARIVVHPNRREKLKQAIGIAEKGRKLLISKYKINSKRIKIQVSKFRQDCRRVELWLEPLQN